MTEATITPPTPTLEQRVAALEQECGKLNLTIGVMHRALLRCQSRVWCADPPRGWKAIWNGIKDLFARRQKRVSEVSELVNTLPSRSIHLEPVIEEPQDKNE